MAKKLTSYAVMGKIHIDSTITIQAESLADAIEKAKELGETDFVSILGEFIDGSLKIYGVYEND